jgi:cysteine-rich repeat protein
VSNKGGTPRVAEMVTLSNNGSFMWSKAATEFEDAQISSYVYANQAKTFTRENLNANLGWLDSQLLVAVNESSSCNAYSTGDDIHFFRRGNGCENTGRLSDVVYHEFGHSLHANSIIAGVGDFDGALSEGISDWLSSAITHDSGMGRGFFMNNNPLRQLNPANGEKVWGVHTTGEVHDDGEIIGGTLWDLRTALFASLGEEAGYAQWLKISYSIMQRAADIPSSYAEALLADDNDGNLDNGTPNQCDIDAAFGLHGLADLSVSIGLRAPLREGYTVTLPALQPANTACETPTITNATIEWKPRGGVPGLVEMAEGADGLTAEIPAQPEGTVVQYRVALVFSNGTRISYPNNAADPFYEFYEGPTEVLSCFDFEDAAATGWTSTGDWQVAEPRGLSGDPTEAHGGNMAFGIDLTQDGAYRNRTISSAESPEIDLQGAQFVRLQYYRHLGVEDGVFDKARILANGTEVWKNFASPTENGSTHHIDREWVFQDIDLKDQSASGKLKLKFELEPDQGLAFGGWTLDDVCVVRAAGVGLTCGNGVVDTEESCDDGNRVDGDGCDQVCEIEGGGCCSASGGIEGSVALGLLTLGFVFWPRRRRAVA